MDTQRTGREPSLPTSTDVADSSASPALGGLRGESLRMVAWLKKERTEQYRLAITETNREIMREIQLRLELLEPFLITRTDLRMKPHLLGVLILAETASATNGLSVHHSDPRAVVTFSFVGKLMQLLCNPYEPGMVWDGTYPAWSLARVTVTNLAFFNSNLVSGWQAETHDDLEDEN